MFVHQSRRQMLMALLGTIPLTTCFHFWRSEPSSSRSSGTCEVVIVDGWILRPEDLKRARVDAT
jgi:hypothetical protein